MSTTPYSSGTHFSDGIRTGPILGSSFVPGKNILSPSSMVATPIDQEPPGIFNAPISVMNVIPVDPSFDRIVAPVQALPGYLDIANTNAFGIKIITYQGIPNVIQLDCARNITIDGLNLDTTQSQFDIYGWDQYGIPMVERIGGPEGLETVSGRKAFSYIRAVFSSSDTVGFISIGVGDTFGLPYFIPTIQAIINVLWENQVDDGVLIIGDQSDATAITGDVRGTYNPTTGANNENMLTIYFYNWSGDAQNYNMANSGTKILAAQPLSTIFGESVITVKAPIHQLILGQQITISGAAGFANISAEQLNLTTTVTAIIDENQFQYNSLGIANLTDTDGGGEEVVLSPSRGNLYATPIGRFGVQQYSIEPV